MVPSQKEFGRVSFDQLVQLIDLVNQLPAEKATLLEAYKNQPEKLRAIVDEDFAWGILYQCSLTELIAFFSIVSGFSKQLAEIATAEDPTEAAILAAYEDDSLPYPDGEDEQDKRKAIFASLMALVKSIDSIRIYGVPLHVLVDRVKRGDDTALFKILRIDRSAMSCPCITDRMSLAELEEDHLFFKKLKNALSGSPKKPKDEYGVLRYILYLLDDENALDDLSIEERYSLFCERLKLYPSDGDDPAKSLDQFIRRWKKEFST